MSCPKGRHRQPEEILNQRFGKLTAISYKQEYSGHARQRMKNRWTCRCDCGAICLRWQCSLFASANPSCGCDAAEFAKMGPSSPHFRGVGELGASYYNGIKARAIKQGWEFAVGIEELWDLYLKQERKCAITGTPIQFCGRRSIFQFGEQTASLDRVNSDIGYTKENVQWLHKDVNLMKNHFSQERFLEVCRMATENTTRPDQTLAS